MIHNSKLVFFGSSDFSVYVLEELRLHGISPSLIITTPDKPKGRKLVLTPNVVKLWAKEHDVEALDPASLKNNPDLVYHLKSNDYNLFLVASYGKIIPKEIFEIPDKKTLNIHPSLLPKYRGASPIQSQILNDEKEIGVSIMVITEGMDEGPVVTQRSLGKVLEKSLAERSEETRGLFERSFSERLGRKELEKKLAVEGARLFAHILPEWMQGVIDPIPQNEEKVTYCKKVTKEDGEIDLNNDPYKNFLKIKAFEEWPTTYFYTERNGKKTRVIITEADFKDEELKILKVIPEGKKEMPFDDFLRGKK